MMSEAQSLIAELDTTLRDVPQSRHLAILSRVVDLFICNAQRLSRTQVTIFDDIIGRLIKVAGPAILAELSRTLAMIGNAPTNVVVSLARNDNLAISSPVLEKSEALTEDVLAEIATAKHPKHLGAIARRAQVGPRITDILIDRGDADVLRLVAANAGAQLSEGGFVKLINRAKTDRTLAELIAKRTDVPAELEPFLKLVIQ